MTLFNSKRGSKYQTLIQYQLSIGGMSFQGRLSVLNQLNIILSAESCLPRHASSWRHSPYTFVSDRSNVQPLGVELPMPFILETSEKHSLRKHDFFNPQTEFHLLQLLSIHQRAGE